MKRSREHLELERFLTACASGVESSMGQEGTQSRADALTKLSASADIRDQLYLFEAGFIFASTTVFNRATSRQPGVLLLTADGEPFKFETEHSAFEARGILVAPNVTRGIDARGKRLVSVHIEPDHEAYPHFRALGSTGVQVLDHRRFEGLSGSLAMCIDGNLSLTAADRLLSDLMAVVAGRRFAAGMPARDQRVDAVMSLLASRPDLCLDELAASVGLSYHRLSHLFSARMGLSLRSYQLWKKVRRAALLLDGHRSLTDIAYDAGFSDSAHLARTFNRFFGIRPSHLVSADRVRICS